MQAGEHRAVLIAGASVAGPALAFWLHQYGFRVTIVEKSGSIRGGGYPIDIRGPALQVTDRMGITRQLRQGEVTTSRISFYDETGRLVGAVRPDAINGSVAGRELEVPRSDLAFALARLLRDDVELIFGDSVVALDDRGGQVDVSFVSGQQRQFDLVIGADGLHSNIRRLAFGPESQFRHDLGYGFAGFSMPNLHGLAHEAQMMNVPGKAASLVCSSDPSVLHGLFIFSLPNAHQQLDQDPVAQGRLVAELFAGIGWEVPNMIEAMGMADDVFCDDVSQIRMPAWTRERIALTGDAAYAPSFLSGQGSSLALVGAYILAGELAAQPDHARAFAAYEGRMRHFVQVNQAQARDGQRTLIPASRVQVWTRNLALRLAPVLAGAGLAGRTGRRAQAALELPIYES